MTYLIAEGTKEQRMRATNDAGFTTIQGREEKIGDFVPRHLKDDDPAKATWEIGECRKKCG
jgi:hypothetical protein